MSHRSAGARLRRSILALAVALIGPPSREAAASGPARLGADGPVRVAVVLTEHATMIDFAGPWEVFQDTVVPGPGGRQRHGFELYTVGSAHAPMRISGGMTVVPDFAFADAPTPDIVVVGAQSGAPALRDWLRAIHADGKIVASVCTGAFHLAQAGLLDGKPATTHHDFFDSFAERFPAVKLLRGRRFVEAEERIFTAGGLTSGIDLALHLVEKIYGRAVAERTAVYMEYDGSGWKR